MRKEKIKNFFKIILNVMFPLLIPLSIFLFIFSYELKTTYQSTDFARVMYNVINTDSINSIFIVIKSDIIKYGYYFIMSFCILCLPLCISLIFYKKI